MSFELTSASSLKPRRRAPLLQQALLRDGHHMLLWGELRLPRAYRARMCCSASCHLKAAAWCDAPSSCGAGPACRPPVSTASPTVLQVFCPTLLPFRCCFRLRLPHCYT